MYMTFLVVGLSYSTDQQSLLEAFAKYGDVVDGKLLMFLFVDC